VSGMKEFWDNICGEVEDTSQNYDLINHIKNKHFDILWERGGKQFVKVCLDGCEDWDISMFISEAKFAVEKELVSYVFAYNFLDCVAIDEERVKQKIKELE